ncbi:MAG TPA: PadR family transcriptional regulator [Solirubrobacterales bacterium]
MSAGLRMSGETLRVLGAMLEDPRASYYGLELADIAGISPGTVYPMLARLEKHGLLESSWERRRPADTHRPRRRLYRLTGLGEKVALREIDEIAAFAKKAKRRPVGGRPARPGLRPA